MLEILDFCYREKAAPFNPTIYASENTCAILDESMRPFLKWAGNKYRCLKYILQWLPDGRRFIEPFTGSAAVFLNTCYSTNVLAEANQDLVNLYSVLQTEGPSFIKACEPLFGPKYNCSETYYQLRLEFNTLTYSQRRAAIFLYLNRHGYNGLCRYNHSGGYNVPFGQHGKPYFPKEEMLYFWSKSKQARIIHSDFKETMKQSQKNDVIYCDPPYAPLKQHSNFSSYTETKFGEKEQIILADLAIECANQGSTVIISNHDTPFTRHYYRDAELKSFSVMRTINCKGLERKPVKELLAVFRA